MRDRSHIPAELAISLMLIATGCNFQPSSASGAKASITPTRAGDARITQVATSGPAADIRTVTPNPSRTPNPPIPSASPTGPTSGLSPTPCTDHAAFVEDITIRDNTLVMPGTPFVKIWRLQNAGTCSWDAAYTTVFIGGERMEASSPVHLTTTVNPGATIDLAVDMVAPDTPGSYQGFWKLIGRSGNYFGIGSMADAAFWVKIIVPALPTETGVASPTLTPTASSTPRPTPEVAASGSAMLELDVGLDLDTGELDPASGSDASLREPTPGAPILVPADGAQMSRYGPPPDPPTPNRCQALNLSGDPIPLSSLSVQGLICYRTTDGRLGYLRVKTLEDGLGVYFVTWGP